MDAEAHIEKDMEKSGDFELVPVSPIRKMEKRVERLEEHIVTHKDLKDMFKIVKANQEAVDQIVKLNRDMIEKVSELSSSVASIAGKVGDFLSRIEVEELPMAKEIRGITDYNDRLVKMENRLNALILALSPRVKRPIRPGVAQIARPIAPRPMAGAVAP